jgi:methylglyoxal synthase
MTAAVRWEMPDIKRVALVAHDNKKRDLLDWAAFNRDLLGRHTRHATGNTGRLLGDQLGLPVETEYERLLPDYEGVADLGASMEAGDSDRASGAH